MQTTQSQNLKNGTFNTPVSIFFREIWSQPGEISQGSLLFVAERMQVNLLSQHNLKL
jgi:hypothetical protein